MPAHTKPLPILQTAPDVETFSQTTTFEYITKDEILSLKELTAYLKLPRSTVYYMCRVGKIPSIKLGKQLRFRKAALDKWLDKMEKERAMRKQR